MIRRLFLLVLTLSLLATPGWPTLSVWAEEAEVRLMVELREANDELTKRDFRRAVREVRRISDRAPRSYAADGQRRRAADLRRWRVVEVAASQAAATQAELIANPAVASVRQEQIYRTTRTPNDPLFADQYALAGAASVQATGAWGVTTGSSGTVIAIVDGGVDLTHQDLKDKLWQGPNGIHGWDFVTDEPAGSGHRHGTHVAGIAGASANNGIGIAGADWAARLMSVRVLNSRGLGYEEDIVAGIDYAVANGADIINLSIAGSHSEAILDAVENAYAANVLVVAAAGNSGRSTDSRRVYPVCAERNGINMVLGVGATDDDGEPKSFSNYGSCVDVSAPGDDIVSTIPGNRYREMSGTSMSAPLVSGVAGLYLAKNPGASPSAVINALVSTMDPFVGKKAARWNQRYKGRLNAARALGAPNVPPVPSTPPQPTATPAPTPTPRPARPQLDVVLSGPSEVTTGGTITYTVTIKNTGSTEATNVRAVVDAERRATFTGASSCAQERRSVACSTGTLSAGSSATYTLTFDLANERLRCGKRLRARATAYADYRGRNKRLDRSDRLTSTLTCS